MIKFTTVFLCANLLIVSTFCQPSTENGSRKLLQEYFTIAHIATDAPDTLKPTIIKQVQETIAHAQSPEQLYTDIYALRKTLQESSELPCARTIFEAEVAATNYPSMHGSFDAVWQVLTYCGFFCLIFLVLTAIKDDHARKLMTQGEALDELNIRHKRIKHAAHTTIKISKELLTHKKAKA